MIGTRILCVLVAAVLAATSATGQTGIPFNQRDDQYVLLGLKRAKELYEVARSEYERVRELQASGMASQAAVDGARRGFADAEVNYQQSMLAVLFEQQYVAVTGAVKYQAEDGSKHVRLSLENTSRGGEEFHQLLAADESFFRSLQLDTIHNVYVSLLNDESAIISQPYEAKIRQLRYAQPVTIDFALLQELDAVTVNLLYGNGSTRAVKIYLQKDASSDRVLVQSEQFSQEAELGGSATFGLELELFSGTSDTFRLEVLNLPPGINRYFVDPATQARLRQLRFTESGRTRQAALRIFLPDRASEAVEMDEAVAFYVLAVPEEKVALLGGAADRKWTEDQIEDLQVGYARLELVPRGVGKLLVRAPQLFFATHAGDAVSASLEVVNEGTRPLANVEVVTDPPFGWSKSVEPAVIPLLGVGEEHTVKLGFQTAETTSEGSYEVRVKTTSFADEKAIEGEDKTITVRVEPRTSVAVPAILVSLLLATVTGVVLMGVRLARR